jgi:HD superfamily phosphodiesterase
LSKLKDLMHTATGRAIAAERHAFMAAFFRRLGQEARGER